MPNIASVFKDEIVRVARKEIRNELAALKKASAAHRAEIAALKRRAQDLEREVKGLTRAVGKAVPAARDAAVKPTRFSAKGLASQRKRLALSAADCGLLVGASGQSVYNWEAGTARPRASHLAAIASLRSMGKKEAAARLRELRASPAPAA
ncbi:XRE family transcriptional regulator OS=Rhizobacter sp. Root404 OX=1736528 GN=ASC76_05765 PE=4 SV=1 [Rhizobacter fulvus]|jgi:DNA-binding transcriptional regulator YiaG